ncbi:hypothetical protein ABZX98_28680 [Streptomyces sp. NPDC002992]|uniref:hypothetical protein n=1 Tax=Streptomyces sp. NPDC002992 TaxID=3154273 RepID=UPI0033AB05C1
MAGGARGRGPLGGEAGGPAARLLVADVRDRGSVCPDELVAWELTVNDPGRLWLPGIGMPMN